MCTRCGTVAKHSSPSACIDGLRDRIADLQIKAIVGVKRQERGDREAVKGGVKLTTRAEQREPREAARSAGPAGAGGDAAWPRMYGIRSRFSEANAFLLASCSCGLGAAGVEPWDAR